MPDVSRRPLAHERRVLRRRRALAALALLSLSGCSYRRRPDPLAPTRALLAPTGRLRVGLVRGSPVSIVGDPVAPDVRGVGWAMGRAAANRLEVPLEPVLFSRSAEVTAALAEGRIDLGFVALGPAAPPGLVFTSPFLHLEQGGLVRAGSGARSLADLDRPGTRLGIAGDAHASLVQAAFRQAKLVQVSSTAAGVAMLAARDLDAFAADKAVLHFMAQSLPGARVLEGRWGVERLAAAIPASREAGLAHVQQFVTEAQREGLVDRAVELAGLRGVVPPGLR